MNTGSTARYTFLGGALTVAGLFIFLWMIQIQTSQSARDLVEIAQNSYLYNTKTFYPERGNIYDRWGRLMAGNREVYEVGIDLRYARDPQTIALTLSQHIPNVDYNTLYGNIVSLREKPKEARYLVVSGNVTREAIDKIGALKEQLSNQIAEAPERKRETLPSLAGVLWNPHLQRSYPEHELGSTVIGFYAYRDREKGRGYFGVEGKYDHLLSGTPIELRVPQDPNLIDKPSHIPPGVSLVLTIDREIQGMLERTVDEALKKTGSTSATIIVMDPNNGEILGMATTPRLDPNEYWLYAETFPNPIPYNRAVGETYETGSVFKVFTMAAALDIGMVTPDTTFLDTGSINVGGIPIYNWNRGAWGPQTMTGCMQHSLNVCLAWLAVEMGPTNFYNYMQRFGIGHLTGIDLAGEVNWPLSVQGDANWYPINLGTNSFGQGVASTPIQMITAMAAVANNRGEMMAPHVLKSVIENGEQYNNPPQVIGTPIKA
jgi:cell division protein FtsI/penicillin-binding protein 2